jgi:hypothetical protein
MQPAVRRGIRAFLPAVFVVVLCGTALAREPEDSVFVYGLFAGETSCPVIEQRLAALPLRQTVILSVEESGGRFVLDDPAGDDHLRCAMSALTRSRRRVKVMILQDASFVTNVMDAARRMIALSEFAKRNRGIESAVVDIEPYAEDSWVHGTQAQRRDIALRFTQVLKHLKKCSRPLKLEAALPWWLTSTKDVPEIGVEPLFGSVDGVYLMLYGLGGAPSQTVADRIVDRLSPKNDMLKRGHVYLTLNTEDQPSAEQMDRDLAALRRHYQRVRGFAGISVFHAAGTYAAPAPAAQQ